MVLSACALAVGFIATSSAAAGASTHARPHAKPRASSSHCHYTSSQPELAQGSSGTAVKQAQCELNWAYAYAQSTNYGNGSAGGLTVDGSFGAYTNEATRNFQACPHLCGRHHRPEHVVQAELLGQPVHVRLRLVSYRVSQPTYAR